MTMLATTSHTQEWFRSYSDRLEASYNAAAHIQHNVTKGESREQQVIDVLQNVLPALTVLDRGVVIADSNDKQSSKFDAVLFDRQHWPRLYQDGNSIVVMVESVLLAIEVKSNLKRAEIADIFTKAASLHDLFIAPRQEPPPTVTAFSYRCENLLLSFFDFVSAYLKTPSKSPTVICTLNKGLFCLYEKNGQALTPTSGAPRSGLTPGLVTLERDSLLLFMYLLSKKAALGSASVETYQRYIKPLLSLAPVNYFDEDYLVAIADQKKSAKARKELRRRKIRIISGRI